MVVATQSFLITKSCNWILQNLRKIVVDLHKRQSFLNHHTFSGEVLICVDVAWHQVESKTKPYLSPYYFSFREPAKDKQHFSVAVSWRQKIKQEMCRWSWRVICERNNLSCLVQLNKRGRGKEGEVMDDGEEEAVHVMRIAPSRLTELPLLENDTCFGTIGCGNLANGGLARAHGMAFLFQPLHLKQYLKMHSAVIFTIIQRIWWVTFVFCFFTADWYRIEHQ